MLVSDGGNHFVLVVRVVLVLVLVTDMLTLDVKCQVKQHLEQHSAFAFALVKWHWRMPWVVFGLALIFRIGIGIALVLQC